MGKEDKTKTETTTGGYDSKTSDDWMSPENINKFQDLLNRLQLSKQQQAEQTARESRKGTFAQGIASMMSNF